MRPGELPKWKHTCTVCGRSFFYAHERVMDPPLIPRHKLAPGTAAVVPLLERAPGRPPGHSTVECVGTGTWGAPEGMGYESEYA